MSPSVRKVRSMKYGEKPGGVGGLLYMSSYARFTNERGSELG
jgi:hypothetical protein